MNPTVVIIMTPMICYVIIYGRDDMYDGNNSIIIKVTKETKDRIYGYTTSLRGNQRWENRNDISPFELDSKIVIIKANVAGWCEW